MSETPSEAIARLLAASKPVPVIPKPPPEVDTSPKTSLTVLQLLEKAKTKKTTKNHTTIESRSYVHTVALGVASVRHEFYKKYHKDSLSYEASRHTYFALVRCYEDDAVGCAMMLGISAYKASEKAVNPYDKKGDFRHWLEWNAGFHHARRKAGNFHELDAAA